jgi:hypothetical protein
MRVLARKRGRCGWLIYLSTSTVCSRDVGRWRVAQGLISGTMAGGELVGMVGRLGFQNVNPLSRAKPIVHL